MLTIRVLIPKPKIEKFQKRFERKNLDPALIYLRIKNKP